MIGAEEQVLPVEIYDEAFEIVPAPLDFDVLPFVDIIDANVHFAAAGHRAGHFLAEKKIGIPAQRLRCVYGIVIGDRNQVHALALQGLINGLGIVVALATNPVEERDVTLP